MRRDEDGTTDRLGDLLAALARAYGDCFSVTSWTRSPAHNKAVGGVPDSKHLTGDAIDVLWDEGKRPPDKGLLFVAGVCGLRLIREKDHDHFEVSLRNFEALP